MSTASLDRTGLDARYARALFELALEDGVEETVADELAALERLAGESDEFARLLHSPLLTRDEQRRAVGLVAQRTGLGRLTARFLETLARNRRLDRLARIAAAYRALLAEHCGEITATVIAARALDETEEKALADWISADRGRRVTLDTRVDESLLGGLVVRIGSTMIDGSLATKLKKLERAMKGI